MAAALFAVSVFRLEQLPRTSIVDEMRVELPRFVQVLMSAGDRYLAANVATFRAVVASTAHMDAENFRVQGQVQRDAAWLNPAHEDNYYLAASILPWNGQFDAAQYVLEKAAQARPYDWQPAFYYAFNFYYIKKDPVTAANALLQAAPRVRSESNRMAMENLAYVWYEKGYDPATALSLLENSAKTARTGALRRFLMARVERLKALMTLQQASAEFQRRHGRVPRNLEELVAGGLMKQIPADPFGQGFALDAQGIPVLRGKQ